VISEEEARKSLLEYCDKKCCYGKGAANSMIIQTMQSTSAFHVCKQVFPPKSFGKSHIATPHRCKWTHLLHVLAVQCPLQTSPVTQPLVRHIHTAVPLPVPDSA